MRLFDESFNAYHVLAVRRNLHLKIEAMLLTG